MARLARLVIPNLAHHVLHRAFNRDPVFFGDDDYRSYLANLKRLSRLFGCKVHAFCLMHNHVHLLVNPGDQPGTLARLMKELAVRHARYLRRIEGRRGPVWQGRFRSSPVACDFVLACARYIELNPVRACLTSRPEDYRWSSARIRLGYEPLDIDPEASYLALGASHAERVNAYRTYMTTPIPWDEWATIRRGVQSGGVTASAQSRLRIMEEFGIPAEPRRRGRPLGSRTRIWSERDNRAL